jgi:hypothetical protein
LQPKSADATAEGLQIGSMSEAMPALGVSLGYLDPSKLPQAPKPAKE